MPNWTYDGKIEWVKKAEDVKGQKCAKDYTVTSERDTFSTGFHAIMTCLLE